MSKIAINQKRIQSMREALGEASALVDNDKYLPLFRNRQKNHTREFKQAAKMARNKKNPARWFASLWSVEKTARTLEILRTYINKKIAKKAENREKSRRNAEVASIASNFNQSGRDKYRQMMIERGLLLS